MKVNRIFSVLAGVLTIAACSEYEPFEVPGGIDSSKAKVASLSYDETTSGSTSVGLTWEAAGAVKAGAVSFTIELTEDITSENVENGTFIKMVDVEDGVTSYEAVVSGSNSNGTASLKKGAYEYVRIRANYDGYVFSDWTYLTLNGVEAGVCVGTGAMVLEFTAPKDLALSSTDASVAATWSPVPFATSYVVDYKAASASAYTSVGTVTTTKAEIEGLEAETTYEVRVQAVKADGTTSEYATATIATLEPSKFNPQMTTAAQLVEFFTTEAALASSEASFSLENDIDVSGLTIPAVETFKGTLDGKGHSIKGLTKSEPLFGELTGTVKDLVIEGAFTPAAGTQFGTVTASNNGTISGVTNKATVTLSADVISESTIVAGIAAKTAGAIKGCTNEGAVTVTSAGTVVAVAVAGIVGYQTAEVSDCDNNGAITFTAKTVSAKSDIETVTSALPSVAGVCAFGAAGFSLKNCDNNGKITVTYTALEEGLSANMNRNQHAGVVASPCGDVNGCNNHGEVNISLQNSTKGTAIANYEFIVCVGGIGGGDYYFTSSSGTISNTNYINCTNDGAINVYSDASKANSAIGGIVGWPGQEKPTTTAATGCTNKGAITFDGPGKGRVGGIEGGTGCMADCVNNGVVTYNGTNAACAIGSLCAFHSQTHTITGCQANGEVVTKAALTGGVGGLIGNMGNAANATGEGCSVNCKITTPSTAEVTGLIVGYFNGTTQAITLGTTASPIKVAGSVNGTNACADNVIGTKNANAIHVINYTL